MTHWTMSIDRILPQNLGTHPLMLGFNRFFRQLITAIAAFALLFVTFGFEPLASHEMTVRFIYPSFTGAPAQTSIQDHASLVTRSHSLGNHFSQGNPGKKGEDPSKSPCCGSYCSQALALANPGVEVLPISGNSNWPMSVQLLTSADTIGFKRPPRNFSGKLMRA